MHLIPDSTVVCALPRTLQCRVGYKAVCNCLLCRTFCVAQKQEPKYKYYPDGIEQQQHGARSVIAIPDQSTQRRYNVNNTIITTATERLHGELDSPATRRKPCSCQIRFPLSVDTGTPTSLSRSRGLGTGIVGGLRRRCQKRRKALPFYSRVS